MRSKPIPTMTVIKKEDKESKLKAFIQGHLSKTDDVAAHMSADRVFLLVARSHESPVVRALASAISEAHSGSISIKALIMLPATPDNCVWPSELAHLTDYRSLSDLRLLDAHEQLWLDGETAWIGDSMRREPSKRDAYECYAEGCSETAGFTEYAFSRLWSKGRAPDVGTLPAGEPVTDKIEPHIAGAATPDNSAPSASTRH